MGIVFSYQLIRQHPPRSLRKLVKLLKYFEKRVCSSESGELRRGLDIVKILEI